MRQRNLDQLINRLTAQIHEIAAAYLDVVDYVIDPETGTVYVVPAGGSDEGDGGGQDAGGDDGADGAGDDGQSDDGDDGDDGGDGDDLPEGALREAGQRAIDRMKAEVKDARAESKAAKTYAEGLEEAFKAAGLEPGDDIQAVIDAVKANVSAEADKVRVASEIKLAAVGKLADPSDVLGFLKTDQFTINDDGNVVRVDDDGNVATDKDGNPVTITSSIDALVEEKPYLAAQRRQGWGNGDGGARPHATSRPTSLEQAVSDHYGG